MIHAWILIMTLAGLHDDAITTEHFQTHKDCLQARSIFLDHVHSHYASAMCVPNGGTK